jgi:hypothetical protein
MRWEGFISQKEVRNGYKILSLEPHLGETMWEPSEWIHSRGTRNLKNKIGMNWLKLEADLLCCVKEPLYFVIAIPFLAR